MNRRYCLTLNLKNQPDSIKEYEDHHREVWPKIIASIKESGIEQLEIYRYEARLFMIMEVNNDFSFEQKALADANNPVVQQWEELMWKYQEALPGRAPGEKWVLMDKIFEL